MNVIENIKGKKSKMICPYAPKKYRTGGIGVGKMSPISLFPVNTRKNMKEPLRPKKKLRKYSLISFSEKEKLRRRFVRVSAILKYETFIRRIYRN